MPKGIYPRKPHSEQWKFRHSQLLKGHPVSQQTRLKQRLGNLGKKRSLETRRKLSLLAKTRTGSANPFYGKQHNKKTRRKIGEAHKGKCYIKPPRISGDKHWNWKGGITPLNHALRSSQKYLLWRKAVFERDNFTCVKCGNNKGGNLNADHIKPWCDYPELRFELNNGQTLCIPCHKKTPTYGFNRARARAAR